ncbi:hypothetical protein BDZ97DRAFT_1834014 [Flammula alnicola]|nr:hypothetical protein BDZ97DRAFT_1834014 [Flammula alnicola]
MAKGRPWLLQIGIRNGASLRVRSAVGGGTRILQTETLRVINKLVVSTLFIKSCVVNAVSMMYQQGCNWNVERVYSDTID